MSDLNRTQESAIADVDEIIATLTSLEAGWLDGEGLPMSPGSLATAARVLHTFAQNNISMPAVFPNGDGFVQLEWLTPTTHREWRCLPNGSIEHSSYTALAARAA
jgi:hypothetical protein